ncbi:MAG: four helix bundle suffix domain-containing protein [Bacteroidaceae bacterium]|nr:four helix bundle suffix domain-containing protein [Bacteroidaceae bacterium]
MTDPRFQVLKRQRPWRDAFYYQKTEVLYQMTYVFCQRFLPAHGDRTVDQMVQAARSGKQNIIEGTEDGETSTEMHIKLLNVARSSLQELREDYRDYLLTRHLPIWTPAHDRYKQMQDFCRQHNRLEDYQPFLQKWNDEEMANIALTLCYMTDTMLNRHLKSLEEEFVTQGGIKERMYAARTGYRQEQDAELARLRQEVPLLHQEIARLKQLLALHGIPF